MHSGYASSSKGRGEARIACCVAATLHRPTFYASAAHYLLAVVTRTAHPYYFTPNLDLDAILSFATGSNRDEWEALSATCENTLQKICIHRALEQKHDLSGGGTRFVAVGRRRCLHFGNKTQ